MAVCRDDDDPPIPHLLCHSCPESLYAPAPCLPAPPCAAACGRMGNAHAALEMQAHPGVPSYKCPARVFVRRPLQLHVSGWEHHCDLSLARLASLAH